MNKVEFAAKLRQGLDTNNMFVLNTPLMAPYRMTNVEANTSSWSAFKSKMQPLATHTTSSGTEFLVTPKSVVWSQKDLNIFAGNDNKPIETIGDLTQEEGSEFLSLNFWLAKEALEPGKNETHVAIGFNPQDLSPGHHSILKLHSHILAVDDTTIRNRQPKKWSELKWFERLTFAEPFDVIYSDFIRDQVAKGLFDGVLTSSGFQERNGFSSLYLQADKPNQIFEGVQTLFLRLKDTYNQIEHIFTNRVEDAQTGRYTLKPDIDRILSLEEYLNLQGEWMQDRSVKLLRYLVNNIKPAATREATDIKKSAQMWISKGFSGALNFTFSEDGTVVRFDYLPRVITTSAIAKTMLGESNPTIIQKKGTEATLEDYERLREYEDMLAKSAQKFGNVYSSHR